MKSTEETVQTITDYVNTYASNKSEVFNAAMSNEHRTLQQSFTKLCLGWIEHVASPEYRTDLRNEASHEMAAKLMALYRESMKQSGYTGSTLDLMSKPSKSLPLV